MVERGGNDAERRAPPAEVEFVTLHGKRRAFVKTGSGPALLLLHGLACDRTTWDRVIPLLAKKYTVIAPDLLGHGLSDKPRADYTLGGYANGMRDLLTLLGIDKVTVVGHSFGGGVAMQFAYQYPERTQRVMLVSSGGLGPEVTPLIKLVQAPGLGGRDARADPARHPAPGDRRHSARCRRTAPARCASTPATSTRPRPSSSRGGTVVPGSPSATWCARSSTGAARSSPCPTAPT